MHDWKGRSELCVSAAQLFTPPSHTERNKPKKIIPFLCPRYYWRETVFTRFWIVNPIEFLSSVSLPVKAFWMLLQSKRHRQRLPDFLMHKAKSKSHSNFNKLITKPWYFGQLLLPKYYTPLYILHFQRKQPFDKGTMDACVSFSIFVKGRRIFGSRVIAKSLRIPALGFWVTHSCLGMDGQTFSKRNGSLHILIKWGIRDSP